MADFNIKQNDTSPAISATLRNTDGSPIDLTGATVRFFMRNSLGSTAVDAIANIGEAAEGEVSYVWSHGDTDSPGNNYAEWQVTYENGSVETFPNVGYISVYVADELA